MNLCSENHDEVCYDGRHCPACSVAEVKDAEISTLKEKVQKLEDEAEILHADLSDAREETNA